MPTNKFHYIWMGTLPTGRNSGTFEEGPNQLAQQLRDHIKDPSRKRAPGGVNPQDQEIIMWVPEAIIEEISNKKMLDPSITLKPVESLLSSVKRFTRKEKKNLETTLQLLGELRAYASQKDLLSAVILEEYGGYFLDTTTSIQAIDRLIYNQPRDIWFPRISQDEELLYDDQVVVAPDIWALYNSKPGNGVFQGMASSYMKRWQFYFPEKFADETFDLAAVKLNDEELKSGYYHVSLYRTGQEKMESSSMARDELIGRTAIYAFLDGLSQKRGQLTQKKMHAISSFAEHSPEGKFIPEYGIEKFHRGLWRVDALAANTEENAALQEAALAALQESEPDIVAETQQQETAVLPREGKHLFAVSGSDFKQLKLKYYALQGGVLKRQIINDFIKDLAVISDKETLAHFVTDFKSSAAYKALSKGRGVTTRMFALDTAAVKEVDRLIETKEGELEQPVQSPKSK